MQLLQHELRDLYGELSKEVSGQTQNTTVV